MARLLVLGDPVVSLGAQTLIPDGGLVIEDRAIMAAGPREAMAALGPFERVLGSPAHFVLPGFVNCHYHSELAIGPGLAMDSTGRTLLIPNAAAFDVGPLIDASRRIALAARTTRILRAPATANAEFGDCVDVTGAPGGDLDAVSGDPRFPPSRRASTLFR